MKKILFLAIPLLFTVSCGETNKEDNNSIEVNEETVKTTDLSQYELPFSIKTEKLTDENGVPLNVEVLHSEGDLEWEIKLGNHFNLIIEDWGNESKNAKNEVNRQKDLEQFFVYNFIEEEDNYVLYSKSIPGDSINVQFNFYAVKKAEAGYFYSIKSNPAENFTLEETKKMLEATKSLSESVNKTLQNA